MMWRPVVSVAAPSQVISNIDLRKKTMMHHPELDPVQAYIVTTRKTGKKELAWARDVKKYDELHQIVPLIAARRESVTTEQALEALKRVGIEIWNTNPEEGNAVMLTFGTRKKLMALD